MYETCLLVVAFLGMGVGFENPLGRASSAPNEGGRMQRCAVNGCALRPCGEGKRRDCAINRLQPFRPPVVVATSWELRSIQVACFVASVLCGLCSMAGRGQRILYRHIMP